MTAGGGRTPASATGAWPSRFALALAAPLAHTASEWLFFVTKPSFLDALPASGKLLVLLRVAAWLSSGAALAAGALWLLAGSSNGARARLAIRGARALLALTVAATLLLLADNFLHTVSGWSTSRGVGITRWLAPAAFLGFFAVVALRARRWEQSLTRRPRVRLALLGVVGALVVAGLLITAGSFSPRSWRARPGAEGSGRGWNVVLVGSDAISASHLASFGGPRQTTPFLDRLAAGALVAVNALPNADSTGGSLTSLLTSALPSTTRVVYPPDIARGPWSFRHLPGVLKAHGYETGQFSLRWYGDSVDLNLQSSFDWANGRRPASARAGAPSGRLDTDSLYFLGLIGSRLLERVAPTEASRQSAAAHRETTGEPLPPGISDRQRMAALDAFLASARRPFFAHLHLLGTHGPNFQPEIRRFSLAEGRRGPRRLDLYDDAILTFDGLLAELVARLDRSGDLARTLLVVYSDHGRRWDMYARVPLLVVAPDASLRGRIEQPAQLLDVAPTVLAALDLPVPEWMRGRSLLASRLDPCPEIFAFGHAKYWSGARGGRYFARATPPFYSLGSAALSVGRRSVTLDLGTGEVSTRELALVGDGGTGCPELDSQEAAARLVSHLAANGYDVSTLRGRLDGSGEMPPPRTPRRRSR